MRLALWLASGMAVTAFAASAASAVTLSFACITNGNAADCATGSAQVAVEVTAGPGANQIAFTFTNVGAGASSITDLYFDDGTLLGIASIVNGSGVSFSQGAAPGNLPGAANASPPFEATVGFTADSNPAVLPNGVSPGELVTIVFDLQSGGALGDVLAELGDGRLRIGVHVQGFAGGGSESFVNVPLPEPGRLALLAAASGLAALRWRRSAWRRSDRRTHRAEREEHRAQQTQPGP